MARQSEERKGRDLTYFVFRLAGARDLKRLFGIA